MSRLRLGYDNAERRTPLDLEFGVRPTRGMPASKDIKSPEQIAAVYAYVKGRADGRLPLGRPAKPSG
jgi:hypothetical protein